MNLVGARPQFIKASALTKAIHSEAADVMDEVLIHSGQHYDPSMSGVFFRELELPPPRYYLGIGSGSHAVQTAAILTRLEPIIEKERPDLLVVYGDTNTTLAGALTAVKLNVPIAHVEAGLRSHNHAMPEEANRRLTDHMSSWLFCPTKSAVEQLAKEGIVHREGPRTPSFPKVIMTGDIMVDVARHFGEKALRDHPDLPEGVSSDEPFVLLTLHRDFNTDNPKRLERILKGVLRLAADYTVLFTVHPRTSKRIPLHLARALDKSKCKRMEPLPYLEMLALEQKAALVITDSGGVQKEGFFFEKPVLVPRPETEWHEIVEHGCAALVDDNGDLLYEQGSKWLKEPPVDYPNLYGHGMSAREMIREILKSF